MFKKNHLIFINKWILLLCFNINFKGINLGNDGIKNTKDDRNEFNAKYYKDYNLVLAERKNNPSEEFLDVNSDLFLMPF